MSGIDWGRGLTNIDHETQIRYGVIHANEVSSWCDAEPDYGDPGCPNCGKDVVAPEDLEGFVRTNEDGEEEEYEPDWVGKDFCCVNCEKSYWGDSVYGDTPVSFNLDDGEYKATQSGDDCDIFVLKSPYYTLCNFCSPCAPGAGYLTSPGNVKAYAFGHSAYYDHHDHPGRAPYRVFRVEDDVELIAVEEQVQCKQCEGTGLDSLERLAEARDCPVEQILCDQDLMKRLNELNFNASAGTFDCWSCQGTGYKLEIVEKEADYDILDAEGICPVCGKETTIIDADNNCENLVGDCEPPGHEFTRAQWLEKNKGDS